MNNIIIVDDEIGVRHSIKAKINWEEAGFHIVGEASSGEEALRLLEEGPLPQVLMTDIRMPRMDGIGLITTCKKLYPSLKLVVLSGYSDYEYMQAAIQSGVKDYLLKPVGRKELAALLDKLAQELKREREDELLRNRELLQREQQLRASREALLLRLAKEESSSLLAVSERLDQLGMQELLQLGERQRARFLTIEMRIPAGRLRGVESRPDLLWTAFQMVCRETAESREGCFLFHDAAHPSMMHMVLLEDAEKSRASAGEEAERFAGILKRNIHRYLKLDCVIGLGEAVDHVQHFKAGFSSSMLSWSRSSTDGINRGASGEMQHLMSIFSPELEKQLAVAVENGDREAFAQYMRRIFPPSVEYSMFSFTFVATRLLLLLHAVANKYAEEDDNGQLQKRLWDCQTTIGDLRSKEAILTKLEELARLVMETATKARSANGGSIAAAVQKYVDDNYAYELTLAGLAELFHLNETYLSGLFKQHAGLTFSEYLTRLRMNKAGELLRTSELKLTDIAMLVGISSSSYFSTSFKKFYGMSPKEYRERGGMDE